MSSLASNDLQLNALRLYGTLIGIREDWGGRLVLCCGKGCATGGIPAAVSVAGGTTLAIEAEAGELKAAMRAGEIDFVVNTLDEALRTLKNEVRQHRPLSVGLIADMNEALDEVAERGVLPDLLLIGMNQKPESVLEDKSIRVLVVEGMRVGSVVDPDAETGNSPSVILSGRRSYEFYLSTADPASLKALDERIQAILPSDEQVRRRWIQQIPRYLRSARSGGGRWVWLSNEEREQIGLGPSAGEGKQARP